MEEAPQEAEALYKYVDGNEVWAQCFPGTLWTSAYFGGGAASAMHNDAHVKGADALIYIVPEAEPGSIGEAVACACRMDAAVRALAVRRHPELQHNDKELLKYGAAPVLMIYYGVPGGPHARRQR